MKSFKHHLAEASVKKPIKWQQATMKYGADNKYSEKILVSVPPRFTIRKVKTYPTGHMKPLLYDKKDKREYLEDDMRSAKLMAREIMDHEYEWQMKKGKQQ